MNVVLKKPCVKCALKFIYKVNLSIFSTWPPPETMEDISVEDISEEAISVEDISVEYISAEDFDSLFFSTHVLKITICPYHLLDLLQRLRIDFRGGYFWGVYFHGGYFCGGYFRGGLSYFIHSTHVLKITNELLNVSKWHWTELEIFLAIIYLLPSKITNWK